MIAELSLDDDGIGGHTEIGREANYLRQRKLENYLTLANDVEEFFLAKGPSSSAEVRGLVIHDIKEVEGVRQQEEQEDKKDEEIGDEVNGEGEEITQDPHET